VVNRRKPRVHTPVLSHYPALAPVHDFVLLFLPPCSPHLTLLATGSLEPSLLRGPARHRPFAPALHLHQRKLSRNLHLQYSAKSQSTPRCQSLVTARSDHPPVLGRSGPQVTPAPTSPSSLSLSSRWWGRAGQHPLVHRGTDTRRRIGSETARGGIERRTVPGGGGFFLFPMGGFRGGDRNAVLRKYPPLKIPEEPPVPLVLPGSSQAR
jgi:hypothetical protein